MCGIAGILGPDSETDVEDSVEMAAALRHRGPDDFGSCGFGFETADRGYFLSFAHARLAVLDLSERGHQPMTSADGRLTVNYNGELYNFRQLRGQLERLGHRFHTESDTEVLLEGYRAWGPRAIQLFQGMFAFAIWDAAEKILLLARDRLGVKPLFYLVDNGALLFASELKGLRRSPRFESEIDRVALGHFLRYGYVGGARTIYQNVRRLMPGQLLTWKQGSISLSNFWTPVEEQTDTPTDFASTTRALEDLLASAVSERLVSDVPVGAFLSGGIDSSAVVSMMQHSSPRPVKTFTLGFREPGYDEAPFAKAVARELGTDHTELYFDRQDSLEVAHELAEIFDEPFGDASAIPTILVSRLARKEVKVVLTGDGGDELFGGYARYRRLRQLEVLFGLPYWLRRTISRGCALAPTSPIRSGLRLLGKRDLAGAASDITARFQFESVLRCLGDGITDGREEYLRSYELAPVAEADSRAMFADVRTYLPDDILTKVDRASMSVGLEARVPLLDHRLVSFCLSLPIRHRRQGGHPKAPLFAVARRHLPEGLLERPKQGFGFPAASLLEGELRHWPRRYLAPSRLREEGILDPEGVEALLARPRPLNRLRVKGLWHLLCFQRWYARVHLGEKDA